MSTLQQEIPLVFTCHGERLIGIATRPDQPARTGVLIIVGGPQYRAGSHRQFTLLARRLAQEGFASFRFDYRGMGDSEGELRYFEQIDDDIHAAIDAFQQVNPDIRTIVLWGLCDAASAALYYANTDSRVTGLILLNPWVHSEASAAKIRLKNYYLSRMLQKSFWIKLLTGGIRINESVSGLAQSTRLASQGDEVNQSVPTDPRHGSAGYIERMLTNVKRFAGVTRFILSGNDLVAQEFIDLTKSNKAWNNCCPANSMEIIQQANHTFSSASHRNRVEENTLISLSSINQTAGK